MRHAALSCTNVGRRYADSKRHPPGARSTDTSTGTARLLLSVEGEGAAEELQQDVGRAVPADDIAR